MHTLIQDLRFALRQIRRSPGFMLTAVLTLALGVGANTAIFSLLDQALLRSLPVRDPNQLVVLSSTGKVWEGHIRDHGTGAEQVFSYPMYRDLRDRGTPFEGLIATAQIGVGIVRNHEPERSFAEIVSGNYFDVLGVEPAAGRLFTQNDDTVPGANPVVVLGYRYWQTKVGADPTIVGRTLSINGHPYQVIGVAAPGFQSAAWGEVPDVFLPVSMLGQITPDANKSLTDHTDRWIQVMGRLKPGMSRSRAETELAPLWHALREEELKALHSSSITPHFIDDFTNSKLRLLPGATGLSYSRDDLRGALMAVMAMALLVLLMASVNVASLLLVRSAGRVREFSVRYALGANARRVMQQLLMEGVLIGVIGGAAGLLIAPAAIRLMLRYLEGDDPSAFHTSLDPRLLVFNFGVALLVSVGFSLAPALTLVKPRIVEALKQQATTSSGPMLSLRGVVVALQVGLSVLLLAGAGLFIRTMQNLRRVDTGLNITHLVTMRVNPQLAGYTLEQTPADEQHLLDGLAALPGVEIVAATNDAVLSGEGRTGSVEVEGRPSTPDQEYDIEKPSITPAFFSALRIPLLAGRAFTEDDDEKGVPVAIVSDTFARHFYGTPGQALGHRVSYGAGDKTKWMTIVGVARDTYHMDLREPPLPTVYMPMKQTPAATREDLNIYMRTTQTPETALATIRTGMRQIDPMQPYDDMRTMQEQVETTLRTEKMIEVLAIAFGLLATLLAGVGLYGVLAYATAQRTREIGIRIALGETRLGVSRLVLAGVLRVAGIGIVIAVPCSILLARLLKSQLFGISSADPLTLGAVIVAVTLVALVSAIVPAYRASSIDPTTALRAE